MTNDRLNRGELELLISLLARDGTSGAQRRDLLHKLQALLALLN